VQINDPKKYTRDTRYWLNQRFDLFDAENVYVPNQAVYGFSAEAFRLEEYARMFSILRLLNLLPFDSVLDVGSADGYMPALIRHLFGSAVFGTDISDRALRRGQNLFDVYGIAADAHRLPFPDKSMDICVCSELLEHVLHPSAVIAEMRRIARKAIVLSTPRAANEKQKQHHFDTLDKNEPHAHIHYFTDHDIHKLCGHPGVYRGARTRLVNALFDRLAWTDESTLNQREAYYNFTIETVNPGMEYRCAIHQMLIGKYESPADWKKKVLTPGAVSALLAVDARLASKFPRLALDHLVVIPLQKTRFLHHRRRATKDILTALLGGYRAEPLRRHSA
jgi:SAM-dependent methyltransferase